MFRSPWEIDAHVRYNNERLAHERRHGSWVDRTDAASPGWLANLRRRVGFWLIQTGTSIAGSDAPRALPVPPAWPEFAKR